MSPREYQVTSVQGSQKCHIVFGRIASGPSYLRCKCLALSGLIEGLERGNNSISDLKTRKEAPMKGKTAEKHQKNYQDDHGLYPPRLIFLRRVPRKTGEINGPRTLMDTSMLSPSAHLAAILLAFLCPIVNETLLNSPHKTKVRHLASCKYRPIAGAYTRVKSRFQPLCMHVVH